MEIGEVSEPRIRRIEELTCIARNIKAGESTLVPGVSGVGKSNLLRSLLDPSVNWRLFGDQWPLYPKVWLDGNALPLGTRADFDDAADTDDRAVRPKWASLEHAVFGMLLGQVIALNRLPDQERDSLKSRVAELDQWTAEEVLDFVVVPAMRLVLRDPSTRLVVMVDQFDKPFKAWPGRFLTKWRSLRDRFKYQLCYVLGTRDDLPALRPDMASYEELYELVAPNVCWVGPFSAADARDAMQELVERRGWDLPLDIQDTVVRLCGGHAGTFRSAAAVVARSRKRPPARMDELAALLLADQDVRRECGKILESLHADEQDALVRLAVSGGSEVRRELLDRLLLKGLVAPASDGRLSPFAPVFKGYLTSQMPPISVDRGKRIVTLNGVPHQLTRLEFKLLDCLQDKQGDLCTRDDIAERVYGDNYSGDVDNARIDTLVERLRKKLEADAHNPKVVLTVKGQGYRLVWPAGK